MSTLRTPWSWPPPPPAERVAVAGVHRARLVDDDDERDVRLLLPVANAHVDRQRLLDRRLRVAAGAVRARPADHDEAAPEVADVRLERLELRVGEAKARNVDDDDAVVAQEAARGRSGAPPGRSESTSWPSVLRDVTSSAATVLVTGQHEDAWLALHDRVRVGPVVLAEGVPGGLDHDPELCIPGSAGLTLKVNRFEPALRSTRSVVTRARSAYRRRVAGWATLEVISAMTSISSPRRAVDGLVSRSTRTSSRSTSPMTRVSTWMPRAAARAASAGRARSCRCRRRSARSASGRRRGTGRRRAAAQRPTSVAAFDRGAAERGRCRAAPRAGARRARPCRTRRCRPGPLRASP